MVINEEEKNAFTQSVMGDTDGGGLPTITEDDEGKVLTVADGSAVWAEGGGESPLVLIEYAPNDMEINKSYNELKAYYEANKIVYFTSTEATSTKEYRYIYFLTELKHEGDYYLAVFTTGSFGSGSWDPYVKLLSSLGPDDIMFID